MGHIPAPALCPTKEVLMDIISSFAARYERTREEEMSL